MMRKFLGLENVFPLKKSFQGNDRSLAEEAPELPLSQLIKELKPEVCLTVSRIIPPISISMPLHSSSEARPSANHNKNEM